MIRRLCLVLLGAVFLLGLNNPSKAQAAGSAVITVEPSATSVTVGQNFELRFYVTPSGATVYSVSINVGLQNITFQSYDASGTAFNGYSGVPSGGSAGSTTFEIAGSYQGAVPGGSGKVYIGKVVANASAAGTGQINLSGGQAYDSNLEAMSTSSQNRTVTIVAPAPPPSGGGGTTPPPSGGGSSTPSNPTTTPNPNSTTAVPTSTDTSTNAPAEIVSEQTVSEEFNQTGQQETTGSQKDKATTNNNKNLAIYAAVGLLVLGILAIIAKYLLDRRRNNLAIKHQMAAGTGPMVVNGKTVGEDKSSDDGPTFIEPGGKN